MEALQAFDSHKIENLDAKISWEQILPIMPANIAQQPNLADIR